MANLVDRYKRIFEPTLVLFEELEDMTPVTIVLPEPPNLKDVVNYSTSTAKQKWVPNPLPEKFKSFSKADKDDFIANEFKRRYDGHWFMNHGKLTYITGTHYLYLNWWNIDTGLPDYRDVSREKFLHLKKIEEDPNCFGMIELTKRRNGKTYEAGCWAYDYVSSHFKANCAIQSKTDDDAKIEVFQKAVIEPWKSLPYFFRPVFDNTTSPESLLKFQYPAIKGKGKTLDGGELNIGAQLGSKIASRASGETTFDGAKVHRYVGDEEGKTIKADVYKRWDKVKYCLINHTGKIIGKALHTSTVEEMEKEGGANFKLLWDGSDPGMKVSKDGRIVKRTPTGLHRHFTPAYRGYLMDDYGNSLVEESKIALQEEVDNATTAEDKAAVRRKFPWTVRQAFRMDAKECYYDVDIIEDRLSDFHLGNPDKIQGNLEWKDNIKNGFVEWTPCDNGRWFSSYPLEDSFANKYMVRDRKKHPTNITRFVMGCDPYQSNVTVGARGSNGACGVFMLRDTTIDPDTKEISKWTTNRFVMTYNHRPADIEDYADDMIKTAVFFGCEIYSENNVMTLIDAVNRRGYGGYLAYDIDPQTGKVSEKPGHHTSDKTHEQIIREFEYHIRYHGRREYHDEILKQCRDFDGKFTKYDLKIACGFALMRAKRDLSIYQPQKVELKNYIKTFKYQGR